MFIFTAFGLLTVLCLLITLSESLTLDKFNELKILDDIIEEHHEANEIEENNLIYSKKSRK